MPVNDPNTFIPPGALDATLRPLALALSKWLKSKFDSAVIAGSNALTGFQGQLRAYSVPRYNNNNPVYQSNNTRSGWLFQWETKSVTTDANGRAVVTYPTAFPNATTAVVCTSAGEGVLVAATHTYNPGNFTLKENANLARTFTITYIAVGF